MKETAGIVVLGMATMMAGCSSTGGGTGPWTNAGLSDTQQQEHMLACQRQAAALEQDYITRNSRGGVNTTTPLINGLKVRQQALAERSQAYEQCLREAGFTRQ